MSVPFLAQTDSAMPCRLDEELMQLHAMRDAITPSTPTQNDGARHAESDDDGVSTEDDEVSIRRV